MKSLSVCLAALFILLCVALGNSLKIGILPSLPLCVGSNDCLWETVTTNNQVIKIVTITLSLNVSIADETLLAAIVEARAAGIIVLARINTGHGKRPLADVQLDVDLCVKLYKVDGVVFDEVPSVCTCKPYYSQLYSYVKLNVAGLVVLNVGVNVPECFGSFADILVVFDSSYDDYLKYVPLPWYAKYPASTFWHNVHSCPPLSIKAALNLAIKLNVGFCYVTDKVHGIVPSLLDLVLQVRLLDLLNLNLNLLGLPLL